MTDSLIDPTMSNWAPEGLEGIKGVVGGVGMLSSSLAKEFQLIPSEGPKYSYPEASEDSADQIGATSLNRLLSSRCSASVSSGLS